MIVSTIDNAVVLVPNKEHKNFTESSDVIPISTTLTGTFKVISGLRRGKPFDYRIFETNTGKIIYADAVSPQPQEFINQKASEAQTNKPQIATETKASTSETSNEIDSQAIIMIIVGAAAGYYIATRKQKELNAQSYLYIFGGAIIGFYANKLIKPKTKNT